MPKGHTVKVKEVWKLGSIFATSFVFELLLCTLLLFKLESFYVKTLNMSEHVQFDVRVCSMSNQQIKL